MSKEDRLQLEKDLIAAIQIAKKDIIKVNKQIYEQSKRNFISKS
jgi:hypothetical protein